ncbi:hypothetical protein VDGD_20334 [Verticillium dahliae]|nr:hypothetical protein VDGD_20334 [Verticillium dahliae]
MPGNLIHQALRRRTDTKHRQAASLNLRAASIGNDLGRDPLSARRGPQLLQLVLTLNLDGDFGLAEALPAVEQTGLGGGRAVLGGGAGEHLVAGEGGVGALGGHFAYGRARVSPLFIVLQVVSRWVGKRTTLCHAEVCPDHEDELAFLLADICNGHGLGLLLVLLLLLLAQAVAAVGGLAVGPVGGVIEDGVVLVNVGLVALDGVAEVAAALGLERGGDEVAANGEDAEGEAGEKGHGGGGEDEVQRVGHGGGRVPRARA